MFSNRNLMATVALVGSIHAASADEASDAVQVLSKLWQANLEARYEGCGGWKILKTEFVGDGKMYKMRRVARFENGKVDDSIDEAPFRVLEEDLGGIVGISIVPCDNPQSSARVGVTCLFGRDCITTTTLTYDPIYNPNAPPKMSRSGPGTGVPAAIPQVSY